MTIILPFPPHLCSTLHQQYESDELEKSVYQDYDSDSDVAEELKQDYVDEQTGDVPAKRSVLEEPSCWSLSFLNIVYMTSVLNAYTSLISCL